nr:Kinase superfamily protein isoform 1 [Ipomoea batatas]
MVNRRFADFSLAKVPFIYCLHHASSSRSRHCRSSAIVTAADTASSSACAAIRRHCRSLNSAEASTVDSSLPNDEMTNQRVSRGRRLSSEIFGRFGHPAPSSTAYGERVTPATVGDTATTPVRATRTPARNNARILIACSLSIFRFFRSGVQKTGVQVSFLISELLCRMEKKHQYAMLASIVHIVNGDWASLVQALCQMDVIRLGTDTKTCYHEFEKKSRGRSGGGGRNRGLRGGVDRWGMEERGEKGVDHIFKKLEGVLGKGKDDGDGSWEEKCALGDSLGTPVRLYGVVCDWL